jgi:hypothetical protein
VEIRTCRIIPPFHRHSSAGIGDNDEPRCYGSPSFKLSRTNSTSFTLSSFYTFCPSSSNTSRLVSTASRPRTKFTTTHSKSLRNCNHGPRSGRRDWRFIISENVVLLRIVIDSSDELTVYLQEVQKSSRNVTEMIPEDVLAY